MVDIVTAVTGCSIETAQLLYNYYGKNAEALVNACLDDPRLARTDNPLVVALRDAARGGPGGAGEQQQQNNNAGNAPAVPPANAAAPAQAAPNVPANNNNGGQQLGHQQQQQHNQQPAAHAPAAQPANHGANVNQGAAANPVVAGAVGWRPAANRPPALDAQPKPKSAPKKSATSKKGKLRGPDDEDAPSDCEQHFNAAPHLHTVNAMREYNSERDGDSYIDSVRDAGKAYRREPEPTPLPAGAPNVTTCVGGSAATDIRRVPTLAMTAAERRKFDQFLQGHSADPCYGNVLGRAMGQRSLVKTFGGSSAYRDLSSVPILLGGAGDFGGALPVQQEAGRQQEAAQLQPLTFRWAMKDRAATRFKNKDLKKGFLDRGAITHFLGAPAKAVYHGLRTCWPRRRAFNPNALDTGRHFACDANTMTHLLCPHVVGFRITYRCQNPHKTSFGQDWHEKNEDFLSFEVRTEEDAKATHLNRFRIERFPDGRYDASKPDRLNRIPRSNWFYDFRKVRLPGYDFAALRDNYADVMKLHVSRVLEESLREVRFLYPNRTVTHSVRVRRTGDLPQLTRLGALGVDAEFEIPNNDHDRPAEQPLNWSKEFPLRSEQLRSLRWMQDREKQKQAHEVDIVRVFRFTDVADWFLEVTIKVATPVRGGILADKVGYGKTATCIGLIVSTLDDENVVPAEDGHFDPKDMESVAACTLAGEHYAGTSGFGMRSSESTAFSLQQQQNPLSNKRPHETESALASSSSNPNPEGATRKAKLQAKGAELRKSRSLQYIFTEDGRQLVRSNATVILVPSQLVGQWMDEISKFARKANLRVLFVKNVQQMKGSVEEYAYGYDVIICSYRLLYSDTYEKNVAARRDTTVAAALDTRKKCRLLEDFFWKRIVYDEFHELESMDVDKIDSLLQFNARAVWGLTGTPRIDSVRSVVGMASLFRVDLVGLQEESQDLADRVQQTLTNGTVRTQDLKNKSEDHEVCRARFPVGSAYCNAFGDHHMETDEAGNWRRPLPAEVALLQPCPVCYTVGCVQITKDRILACSFCNSSGPVTGNGVDVENDDPCGVKFVDANYVNKRRHDLLSDSHAWDYSAVHWEQARKFVESFIRQNSAESLLEGIETVEHVIAVKQQPSERALYLNEVNNVNYVEVGLVDGEEGEEDEDAEKDEDQDAENAGPEGTDARTQNQKEQHSPKPAKRRKKLDENVDFSSLTVAKTDTRSRERLIKLCCNFTAVQRNDVENVSQEINRVYDQHKRRLDAAIRKVSVAMKQVECAKRLYEQFGRREYDLTGMPAKLDQEINAAQKKVKVDDGSATRRKRDLLDCDRYLCERLQFLARLLREGGRFRDILGEHPDRQLDPIWDLALPGLLSDAFGRADGVNSGHSPEELQLRDQLAPYFPVSDPARPWEKLMKPIVMVPGKPGSGEGWGANAKTVRSAYDYGLKNFDKRLLTDLGPAFQPFSFFCRTLRTFCRVKKDNPADPAGQQGAEEEDPPPEFECPVCLCDAQPDNATLGPGEFSFHDIRLTPCGHAFCKDCLAQAVREKGACPTCRHGPLRQTDVCDIANEAEGIRKLEENIEKAEQVAALENAEAETSATNATAKAHQIAAPPKQAAASAILNAQPKREFLRTSWGKLELYNREFGHEERQARIVAQDKRKAVKKYGSKIEAIILVLQKILEDDPAAKCIVFAQWKLIEDRIEQAFYGYRLPYVTLTGSAFKKAQTLKAFQETYETGQRIPAGVPRILLMSFENNASGANLTSANHVLFVHPMVASTFSKALVYETQAIGRARRYGQKKKVHVWRFVTRDTVEAEVVMQHRLALEKREKAKRELGERILKKAAANTKSLPGLGGSGSSSSSAVNRLGYGGPSSSSHLGSSSSGARGGLGYGLGGGALSNSSSSSSGSSMGNAFRDRLNAGTMLLVRRDGGMVQAAATKATRAKGSLETTTETTIGDRRAISNNEK
eukprot:g10838.t1